MAQVDQGMRRWEELARCTTLTPKEADKIFFVGSGGKSKVADEFCNQCPVRNRCLDKALTLGPSAIGFWAGTTEPERRRMAGFLRMLPSQFDVPEPVAKVRRFRKIPTVANPLDDPLYGVEGPSREEELRMYGL